MSRKSTSSVAYEELKRRIIEWEYQPGLHLVEENVSRDLDVSRTPLRQALYRLELEGLIIKQSNGRIHVAPVTIHEVEETYKVREVLEGLLAKDATENITDSTIQELEDVLELMKRAAEQNRKEDLVKYGSRFHQILYACSTNETAKRFLSQLNSRIERYRRIGGYKNPTYILMLPVEEHQEIFKLIGKRDSVAVEQAMRAHISRSWKVAKETLEDEL